MRRLLLLVLLFGSLFVGTTRGDSLSPPVPPVVPVVLPLANLPAPGRPGQIAYVTDCRAITSIFGLVLLTQAAGAGTGCLATSNGTAWQIDGTTVPVTK